MVPIVEKTKREIEEKFTRYEIARILGARALQLAMNAPILLKLSKEELEETDYNSLKIAELEFYSDVLPITVKRPLPQKSEEKIIPVEEPKVVEAEEKKQKSKAERKKAKEDKKELEEKPEEKKGIKEEIAEEEKSEEKIIKEVKGSEIMEMATPTDEAEEEQVSTEV